MLCLDGGRSGCTHHRSPPPAGRSDRTQSRRTNSQLCICNSTRRRSLHPTATPAPLDTDNGPGRYRGERNDANEQRLATAKVHVASRFPLRLYGLLLVREHRRSARTNEGTTRHTQARYSRVNVCPALCTEFSLCKRTRMSLCMYVACMCLRPGMEACGLERPDMHALERLLVCTHPNSPTYGLWPCNAITFPNFNLTCSPVAAISTT